MAFDAVVGLVIDARCLADDDLRTAQPPLQGLHAVFQPAIVVLELAAQSLDATALARHRVLDAADAQHATAVHADGSRWSIGRALVR